MKENKITAEGIIGEALAYNDVLSGSDFPLHIFPAKFQEIVRTTSHCLGYPLDYVANSMLFAASVALKVTNTSNIVPIFLKIC